MCVFFRDCFIGTAHGFSMGQVEPPGTPWFPWENYDNQTGATVHVTRFVDRNCFILWKAYSWNEPALKVRKGYVIPLIYVYLYQYIPKQPHFSTLPKLVSRGVTHRTHAQHIGEEVPKRLTHQLIGWCFECGHVRQSCSMTNWCRKMIARNVHAMLFGCRNW